MSCLLVLMLLIIYGVNLCLQRVFLQNRISHRKTSKTPYELWKGYQPNLKYLGVWGCLAKVMLPNPKKRKIGSKTYDCMFLGYVEHSVAYRFLVLNSDIIERNTIAETKMLSSLNISFL